MGDFPNPYKHNFGQPAPQQGSSSGHGSGGYGSSSSHGSGGYGGAHGAPKSENYGMLRAAAAAAPAQHGYGSAPQATAGPRSDFPNPYELWGKPGGHQPGVGGGAAPDSASGHVSRPRFTD
eukprot:tig00000553_g2082.t1